MVLGRIKYLDAEPKDGLCDENVTHPQLQSLGGFRQRSSLQQRHASQTLGQSKNSYVLV